MSSAVDGKMITKDHGTSQLINGTSQADLLCQKDAERAGLWGTYSALLSTKQHPLQNITAQQYHHLPVVNTMVGGPSVLAELCICIADSVYGYK